MFLAVVVQNSIQLRYFFYEIKGVWMKNSMKTLFVVCDVKFVNSEDMILDNVLYLKLASRFNLLGM